MKKHLLLIASLLFLSSCLPCYELTDGERAQIKSQVYAVHRQIVADAEALDVDAMFSHILDNEGVILQIFSAQLDMLSHTDHTDVYNLTPEYIPPFSYYTETRSVIRLSQFQDTRLPL